MLLSAIATAVRLAMAYNGGIWADEAFFLRIVNAPTWSVMLDFLRFHESHPPFFYALMRIWMQLTGGGDTAALLLPVLIGVLIVPALFVGGQLVFGSQRAGVIAAALGVISTPLAEHSSQLRPYGLLPLLGLVSTCALIVAVHRSDRKWWGVYVVSTTLFIYTHNWAWVLVIGQHASVMIAGLTMDPSSRRRLYREWIIAWLIIGLAYLPWFTTLLYQVRHAGHGALPIEGLEDRAVFASAGMFILIERVFFSNVENARHAVAIAGGCCAIVAVAIVGRRQRNARVSAQLSPPQHTAERKFAARILLATVVTAGLFTVVVSPYTNLMFARCLATLTPLVLLLLSGWCDAAVSDMRRSWRPAVVLALAAYVAGGSVVNLYATGLRPRSNAREVARYVSLNSRPTDLVLIVTEWYAAAFNHYFPPSLEQMDYPQTRRSDMIDFSDVWQRTFDPSALAAFEAAVTDARRQRRRVWLVSWDRAFQGVTAEETARAMKFHQPGFLAIMRLMQIQKDLDTNFGAPLQVPFAADRKPRYADIRAYLYTPPN